VPGYYDAIVNDIDTTTLNNLLPELLGAIGGKINEKFVDGISL
jgi:hypothetical protein